MKAVPIGFIRGIRELDPGRNVENKLEGSELIYTRRPATCLLSIELPPPPQDRNE